MKTKSLFIFLFISTMIILFVAEVSVYIRYGFGKEVFFLLIIIVVVISVFIKSNWKEQDNPNEIAEIFDEKGAPVIKILTFFGVKFHHGLSNMELPNGWRKEISSNLGAGWFVITDDQERVRLTFFQGAKGISNIRLARRFSVYINKQKKEDDEIAVAEILDGDKVIFTTDPIDLPKSSHNPDYKTILNEVFGIALGVLEKDFPNWINPAEYW